MIDVVVKVGGGLLAAVDDLDRTLIAIAQLARSRRVLVVPGGGPFAGAVRAVDRRVGLSDDAAHWMAVLAMDQYAHLLADRCRQLMAPRKAAPYESGEAAPFAPCSIVWTLSDALSSVEVRRVPILAPSRWLFDADPLPHSWEVTSDSIAAWVAGQAGARDLVLVKPRGATGELVDGYFATALPPHVTAAMVPVERAPAAFARMEAPC